MPDQWEFCELTVRDSTAINEHELTCDLIIVYFGEQVIPRALSEKTGSITWHSDPWSRTLGLLGRGGWELVTVSQGGISDASPSGYVTAYLKRPVKPGRAVDNPAVAIQAP